jgi:uncharacterized protein (TIGR03437 family)
MAGGFESDSQSTGISRLAEACLFTSAQIAFAKRFYIDRQDRTGCTGWMTRGGLILSILSIDVKTFRTIACAVVDRQTPFQLLPSTIRVVLMVSSPRSFSIVLVLLISATTLAQAPPTVTTFQQSDPRIAYTGVWYPNTDTDNMDGAAVLANLKGSQCVVTFNGTGITWIGVSDPFSGIAYLDLDGTPSQVDTGNGTATLYQQPLWAVHNLTPGLHTLTIEITHSHDEVSDQSWIWVNAFSIDNGSLVTGGIAGGVVLKAGVSLQTNPAVTYGGHWFQDTGASYLGGSVNSAVDPGAWVNVNFNGTGIEWIGYRDQWSGIAQVYIDGALQATVDTYLSPSQAQTNTYSITGLSPGAHTLQIVGTGTADSSSGGAWIWVNGFNGTGSSGPPAVNSGGVVNAASYSPAPSNLVAPGQIVSIFGSNFLASGSAAASTTPLPTQLNNVTVTACGQSIPLFDVFPTQINAQLPFGCPASGTTPLTIMAGGQISAVYSLGLAAASPGVFTVNSAGTGDGVILHANNTLVNAANPAKGGEQIVIYGTGLGATNPSFATGAPATASNQTVNAVTASIGGQSATVVYSGLTVGFAGLYQINVIVPAALSGSQPLLVMAGGSATSRAGVTVAVTP